MSDPIRVSAVVIRDDAGRVLNVRKRGTSTLMLPGGKPEPGEDPRDTALREFEEELGITLSGLHLRALGEFTAPAANESGRDVVASVYEHPFTAPLLNCAPQAEIEHLEWVDPASPRTDQAPLNTLHVFPALRSNQRPVSRLAVFTGSSPGFDPAYAQHAAQLAHTLARAGIGVVYGGGHVGLMGVVADSAREAGGEVIGVIPDSMIGAERAHPTITRLEVVATMHERKHRMASLVDAFVALPGGPGTLDELFEAWTWSALGLHSKPVALYNVDGYWDPLITMADQMVERGFMSPDYRRALLIVRSPAELLAAFSTAAHNP